MTQNNTMALQTSQKLLQKRQLFIQLEKQQQTGSSLASLLLQFKAAMYILSAPAKSGQDKCWEHSAAQHTCCMLTLLRHFDSRIISIPPCIYRENCTTAYFHLCFLTLNTCYHVSPLKCKIASIFTQALLPQQISRPKLIIHIHANVLASRDYYLLTVLFQRNGNCKCLQRA